MRLNKKATIAEGIFDIAIALIVLFLGVIIMFSLSKINEEKKEGKGNEFMDFAISNNMASLYLKKPVEIQGNQMNMADLLVLAYENKEAYQGDLEQATKAFFHSTLGLESSKDYFFCMRSAKADSCVVKFGNLKSSQIYSHAFVASGSKGEAHLSELDNSYSQLYLPSPTQGPFEVIILTRIKK